MVKKSNLIASIIIRGKNEAKWLKILMPILQQQTVKNYEIIFCDNNSSDNSIEIIKKYKIKKILKFKKYLPGKILNLGIKKSVGKYISILSSHCIPTSKNWLKEHINSIERNNKFAAVFGKQIPLPGTSVQNLIDLDIIFKNEEILYSKDPYLNNANSIYRANILKKNLFNNTLTNIEDRDWANKITQKGYKILYSAKSEVYHLHGIHQHNHKSIRSRNTYNILIKKYLNKWKTCSFLRTNNFKYCLIINARREHDFIKFKRKLGAYLKRTNKFSKLINKIVVITNFKVNNNKNIYYIKSSKFLEKDLINIYKKFKKDWIEVNYLIYNNLSENSDFNNLIKLIDETVYYSHDSSVYGEIIKENFLIHYKGQETFKSTRLNDAGNKPKITLIKLSKGSIADVDYLRNGKLISDKTFIRYI